MSPVPSAEGLKINWLNYKTGVRFIGFRLDADNKKARIAIEISHPDKDIREIFFGQFIQLKHLLHMQLAEEWVWIAEHADGNGKSTSLIYTEIHGVNIFNREGWPEIISFFKPRIIALDEFWSTAKYGFESLL